MIITDSAGRRGGPRPATFLQVVALRLMGPPASAGGRWTWPCPACDDRTAFSAMPDKPPHKDRVICHRCGFRGDEADLMLFFHPGEKWPARRARLDEWRAGFDALPADGRRGAAPGPRTFSPPGAGTAGASGPRSMTRTRGKTSLMRTPTPRRESWSPWPGPGQTN
jgi:hypothetical protein